MSEFQIHEPDWHIPNVRAFTVLAFSIDNEPVSFDDNSIRGKHCRELLEVAIRPKYPVTWLRQIHSHRIVKLPADGLFEADGSYTDQRGIVCAVITADCLPIVFTNSLGSIVGIVHAGRKGLCKEIISEMLKKLGLPGDEVIVWIGPGISQKHYPVSKEIKDEFVKLSESYDFAFQQQDEDTFLLDLNSIARHQLKGQGILEKNIFGANCDTYSDSLFHSARRDKSNSGRMVTVVWIKE